MSLCHWNTVNERHACVEMILYTSTMMQAVFVDDSTLSGKSDPSSGFDSDSNDSSMLWSSSSSSSSSNTNSMYSNSSDELDGTALLEVRRWICERTSDP